VDHRKSGRRGRSKFSSRLWNQSGTPGARKKKGRDFDACR
jgi:hypothetical protein